MHLFKKLNKINQLNHELHKVCKIMLKRKITSIQNLISVKTKF